MTDSEAGKSAQVLANRRRQAYFRRRREIQRVARKAMLLQVDRLDEAELWRTLQRELLYLYEELEAGASPRHFEALRRAEEAAAELFVRGHQLKLDI